MTASKLHPAYASQAAVHGLPLDSDSRAYRCWVVAMLAEWRATSGRFPKQPYGNASNGARIGNHLLFTREMTHDDHRAFAAWMEQAS